MHGKRFRRDRDEPKGGAVVTNLDHIRDLVLHHDCADRNPLQLFSKGQLSSMQMNTRT